MAPGSWLMPARLDAAAAHIESMYRGYLTGLVATLAGIFDRPHASTERARGSLDSATLQQFLGNQGHASELIRMLTDQSIAGGLSVAKGSMSDEQRATMDTIVREGVAILLEDIMAIGLRDRAAIHRAWRSFALEAHLIAAQHGRAAALFARQGKIAGLKFRQFDRAGRQHESARFVRDLVRHHLVQTQADVAAYAIQKGGADQARIVWPAAGDDHPERLTVSLSGRDATIPSYGELRASIFHPNSTARMEAP